MIRIYIIAHHDESLQRAKELCVQRTWGVPTLIPTTFLLESYFYTNLIDYEQYKDLRWVGTMSHKAELKMGQVGVEKAEIMMKKTMDNDSVHVLGFFNPLPTLTIAQQAEECHPGLMKLIKELLIFCGESPENVHLFEGHSIKMFYANYFAARPEWMLKLTQWFQKIMLTLCVHREMKEACWEDSKYGDGDPTYVSIASRVYGMNYFPMHVFVCERIIPYFFHTRGANVVLASDDP